MVWSRIRRKRDSDSLTRNRYIISIRMTGLGDRLICLGAAWLFARNTGRTLIADWRYGSYTPQSERNTYALCFESSHDLAGVPFVGDDSVAAVHLPLPRYPAFWNNSVILAAPYLRPADTIFPDRDAAVEMIRARGDVDAPTIIFDACVNDGLVSLEDSRTFLGVLRPTPRLRQMATAFSEEYLGDGPTIGLHIRHGNGAPTGHARYWHSFQASIDRCERAVRVAREEVGRDAQVLLCTDSLEVESAVRIRIPGVISRAKEFRRPGDGELHVWHGSDRMREDAMVEMLLLAKSSALIRYPPRSFYTFYAAVMKPRQSSTAQTLYGLQRPYDPDDPLSPALLI